jgi:hypothetical protein
MLAPTAPTFTLPHSRNSEHVSLIDIDRHHPAHEVKQQSQLAFTNRNL